jgi:hypothetical protein
MSTLLVTPSLTSLGCPYSEHRGDVATDAVPLVASRLFSEARPWAPIVWTRSILET